MKESDRLAAMGETLAARRRADRAVRGRLRHRGADAAPRRGRCGPGSTTASPCRWRSRSSSPGGERGACSTTCRAWRPASRPSSTLLDQVAEAPRDHRTHRALRRRGPPGRPQPLAGDAERRVRAARDRRGVRRAPGPARAARGGAPRRARARLPGAERHRPAQAARRPRLRRARRGRARRSARSTRSGARRRGGRGPTPTRPPASRCSRRPARRGARALLVGAGGAARAAAWALLRLGADLRVGGPARRRRAPSWCSSCSAARRRPARGAEPVDVGGPRGARPPPREVVVNGTSVGLRRPRGPAARAPAARRAGVPRLRVRRHRVGPGRARGRGAAGHAARQILVRQGALAFTWWTGRPAPEAVMAAAIGLPGGAPR